jgi:hypothetical protein
MTLLYHIPDMNDTQHEDLIHLKTIAYSHEILLWCGHNKIIMRLGVHTALLYLLCCWTSHLFICQGTTHTTTYRIIPEDWNHHTKHIRGLFTVS